LQLALVTAVYRDTISTALGCDSIVITNLTITPRPVNSVNRTVCFGGRFTLPSGRTTLLAGTYRDTVQTSLGCDSVVVTNLSIDPIKQSATSSMICSGVFYQLPRGRLVGITGVYKDTVQTALGCDSIITTTLTVTSPLTIPRNIQICSGQSYRLPLGGIATTSGDYRDTIISAGNCTNIILTRLVVNPVIMSMINKQICAGETYTLPKGRIVGQTGTYRDTLRTNQGCDSILITNLNVAPVPSPSIKSNAGADLEDGDDIELRASPSQSNFKFIWYDNNVKVDTLFSTIHRIVSVGDNQYKLTVKDTSGCQATVTFLVFAGEHIKIPNAFSPNGDVMNDKFNFVLSKDNKTGVVVDQFQVYNRYGQLCYDNADPENGWDGKYMNMNSVSLSDVYVYKIALHNKYGKTYQFSGEVLLVR
jgi:gliding motility-associated-like protein